MQRGLEFCSNNFSDNIPTGKDKSFQTKKNIGAILVLRNCPQRALPFLRYFLRQNFVTEANSCEILCLLLRWNYFKQISNKKTVGFPQNHWFRKTSTKPHKICTCTKVCSTVRLDIHEAI